MQAIKHFDRQRLDAIFNGSLYKYPEDIVMDRLLVPVFNVLGNNWDTHPAGIAEEHFASTYFLTKILSFYNHQSLLRKERHLLVSTLPGERHEMGLVLFCLELMQQGIMPHYAGPDLPISQYETILEKTRSAALLLSGKRAHLEETLLEELTALEKRIGLPIFIGGAVSLSLQKKKTAGPLIPLGESFKEAIEIIRGQIMPEA